MQKVEISLSKNRKDLCSRIYDHIFYNYGMNIWADFKNWKKEEEFIIIPLNATIPNFLYPFGKKRQKKHFMYNVLDVGEIKVNIKTGYILDTPRAEDIDVGIFKEFWRIHRYVDEVVRDCGRKAWGKMTFNRAFLAPFYAYIQVLLNDEELNLKLIRKDRKENWITLLTNRDYAKISDEGDKLFPGNQLLAFLDEAEDPLDVPDLVVGDLIAKDGDYISKVLKIRSFIKYIDLTNTYYFLAADYGELIPLERKILGKNFEKFANRRLDYQEEISLQVVMNELLNRELLIRKGKNIVIGNEEIFNQIIPYREEMLGETMILPAEY